MTLHYTVYPSNSWSPELCRLNFACSTWGHNSTSSLHAWKCTSVLLGTSGFSGQCRLSHAWSSWGHDHTSSLHVCVLKFTLVYFCTLGSYWVPYALQVKPCLKHMGAWLALILLQVGAEKSSTRKCIGKFRISSCFSRIVFVIICLSSK